LVNHRFLSQTEYRQLIVGQDTPIADIRDVKSMKLVRLARHAESTANVGQATFTPRSIPLTERGLLQAEELAASITRPPDLIVTSTFERARLTAQATARLFPSVPTEVWPVQEFSYLNPTKFLDSTPAERKPHADAYWDAGNPKASNGPGTESFARLLKRASAMLDQLAAHEAENVWVFSHAQFIRATAWFIKYGEQAGAPAMMRQFRDLDVSHPLGNCWSYQFELLDGRWFCRHQLSPSNGVKFIDQFCNEEGPVALPAYPLTQEIRDSINGILKNVRKH
jgi:broad specificity phosphatase PhoE